MGRRNRTVVGVGTPNDVVGAFTPDQVVVGFDAYGCPVVGSFWGGLAHALNPVNVVKTAANMVAMPVQAAYGLGRNIVTAPINLVRGETQALRNLFSSGGGGSPAQPPGMPPGQQYMPPGTYPQPQPGGGWGGQPTAYNPNPAPPPGYPPGFAPQQYPNYAPAQSYDPNAYYGPQDFGNQPTGWDAAYGGGQ